MRAQRQAGFDVQLACSPGEHIADIEAEGFGFHPIAFQRSYNLPAHWRAYRQLKRLLAGHRFDVVHAHTPIAAAIARRAAADCRVPLVLYTAHGFYFHDAMAPVLRRAHIALERWAQRRADFLFTQSAEDCQSAIEERIAPASAALAIGNGVDVTRFGREGFAQAELAATRRELGLAEGGGPVIIMIGRLVREKGYLELLEALAAIVPRHPNMRVLAIGKALASDHDASAGEIQQAVNRLGLQKTVIFTGLRADIPRLLSLGDLFCLPSWREGMPRSVIEAMATGLPVVATSIRGCREEVVDGQTGLLVPPRDAKALAAALDRLLGDPALREQMGRAGRAPGLGTLRRAAGHRAPDGHHEATFFGKGSGLARATAIWSLILDDAEV